MLGEAAEMLINAEAAEEKKHSLEDQKPYTIYGADGIEHGARHQMDTAMRLPITVGGALMADAHHGYGLPIGGVLATRNEVIPYGVGVDIGCRMCLSIYDVAPSYLEHNSHNLKNVLVDQSKFGKEVHKKSNGADVLDHKAFGEIELLRGLKDKAYRQLGSSGGGNHFVEFGIVHVSAENATLDVPAGKYFGLLTHSGSRGLGAAIANHYTRVAKSVCQLPDEAKHLAWLDLDSDEGQEYWIAMNLAGDYASACHHDIHRRMAKSLGIPTLRMVENHHNFAWKEEDADGDEVIVHRKGATPAGKGVLGIIPGSMTAPGFIVEGRGETASINSASHGAGRIMSRTRAKASLSQDYVNDHLKKAGVEVIGSGLDEAPMAYKDINAVMREQVDLVNILGTFAPKIVRMCGDKKVR